MKRYLEYIVEWIREEVNKAKMSGVIIGISGGVDSAVVAALGKKAFPDSSLGVIMPIGVMDGGKDDAMQIAKSISIEVKTINLTDTFENFSANIDIKNNLATANIKPRLRMTTLYALAQDKKYLVLGTDNLAEWELGYFTKYGDGGVDLLPIVELFKSQIFEAAKILELPSFLQTKIPTADLWNGQSDEEEMGFAYIDYEKYKLGTLLDETIIKKIEYQISMTSHKRNPLPKPKKLQEVQS